jgi:hypothetical protein
VSEDRHPGVMAHEAQEAFMQHLERGSSRIKLLSIITIIITIFLAAAYVSQLVLLPYVFHIRTQTVNLLDPGLVISELVLLTIVLIWLSVAVRELIFVTRLSNQIREIRSLQAQIEKKISS